MSRRIGVSALMLAGWFAAGNIAQAQQAFPFHPLWQGGPGLNQAQLLAGFQAQLGRPGLPGMGGNPFFGPMGPGGFAPVAAPFNPLVGGGFPGVVNPYTPLGGSFAGGAVNPYTPFGGGDPYGGSGRSYFDYYEPTGGTLRGAADVVRAHGAHLKDLEQARLMRQEAYQARLDTIRKKFDLDMYIKANTPTFTEEQARIASLTLRRIQNNATQSEITSGKSLNVLLDDLRKFPGKKVTTEMPPLSDDILLSLNVTSSTGSLGILRDGKVPAWPTPLQEIYTPAQLRQIEDQLLSQLRAAESGGTDPNVLTELRRKLNEARDKLGERINDIPTSDYLNGKRFLNDLDQARIALERGEARHQLEYMKWARGGPRSPQDLADYLTARGLKIAPSTVTDEAAYRAAHSALAALDVQMNAQFAEAAPVKEKEY